MRPAQEWRELESGVNTYCAYCEVGQDNRVVQYLERLGYPAAALQQVRRYYHQDKESTRRVPLLPRYVFFDAAADAEIDWYRIYSIPYVQKVLEYGDGERALRAEDLEFVAWMKSMHGLMEISQVLQVGSRIRVIGGPLKHYEGNIVEVKKHRGVVAVQIGENAHFAKVWCPVEYIEQAE